MKLSLFSLCYFCLPGQFSTNFNPAVLAGAGVGFCCYGIAGAMTPADGWTLKHCTGGILGFRLFFDGGIFVLVLPQLELVGTAAVGFSFCTQSWLWTWLTSP